jgi:hypothetical protein
MKISQLEEISMEDLEQSVQDLNRRYAALFPSDMIQEDSVEWSHIILMLKEQLLASEDTSYEGIDFMMREISHVHDVSVQDLHDAFVNAEGVTPDEWIHAHKSVV